MLLYQKSVQNKIKLYIKLKQYNLPKHKLAFNLKCVHECMCVCMWPGYFIIYKITFLLCIFFIYIYIYVYPLMMSHDNLQIEFTPFLLSKLKFCTLFLDRRFNYNIKLVSLIFAKNIEGEISRRRLQLAQDSSCFMSGSSEIENKK